MPDVGNLNIEITSNASEASKGLYNVADALSRIKAAVPNNGIGLSKVATELNKFAKQINQAKATNAVLQNIANFGKGLKDVTSAIKATSKDFDTSKITGAIDAIKASVGDGIKLGQSGTQLKNLKDALGGDWNTEKAQQAGEALKFIAEGAKSLTGTNLGTIAKNVSAVAKALDEYATSSEHMISAVGGNKQSMSGVWETVEDAAPKGKSRLPVNLQFHGWREEMSGMADAAKEVEKTSSSFGDLKEVADVLSGFKTSKNDGANIEALAAALDHLKRVTVGGIPLTAMINSIGRLNEKAGELKSNGTVDILHDLAEALRMVKESAEGMQTANIKINFGGGRGSSRKSAGDVANVENVMQQAAKEVDATFESVQSTVHSIADDIGNINASLIELNNIGGSSADQAERMARAFAYMFEMASKMRSAGALPWGSMNGLPEKGFVYGEGTVDGENVARIANETRDIILYDENMEQSWEHIATKIEAAKRELDDYFASQKQVIFGNESIKGIYEDIRFGPTLAGFYGKNAQANMIDQIANGTGLSVKNIVDQLYELSHGAIDLRNAFEEAASDGAMDAIRERIERVGTMSEEAVSKIDLLGKKIQFIREKMNFRSFQLQLRGKDPENDATINNYKLQILGLYDQINKIIDKAHEAQEALRFEGLKGNADNLQRDYGLEMVDNLVNQYSEIDLLTMKMNGMKQALADDINQNKVDTQQIAERTMAIQKLRDKIEELKKAQEDATGEAKKMSSEHVTLGSVMKSMFPTLTGIMKRFKGMLISRSIRYVIRQIASGFSEGVQNVYQYSKAIGTAFAPAMDDAATAIAQMKNSVGAAAAPLIQALIPALQTVINWFITAINYVNQFLALLNGQQTWTRALPKTVNAFDKQEKGAKKAGAALKDLLADWDELNIIQSQGGGGGSVGSEDTAEEYLKMFEEVGRFDSKIKETVAFLKDNFDTIKTIAEGIGLAILGWKISKAFGKDLSLLQKLELAAGLTLLVTGVKLAASAGYSIGKNGFNGENIGDAVLSVLAGMGGGALIGFSLAGVPGAVIGATVGTLLTLSVMKLAIDKGKLDSLYGDVEEDIDTIRTNLENDLLNVDAKLDITVYKAQVKNVSAAVGKVKSALTELEKTYPVSVMITSDTEEDFREKVNKLVETINEATKTNAAAMKEVYVPATAEFTPNFIDDAWKTIGNSVTKLGKQIGEELDKEITDNTKLDELQRKLERLAEIMVDVTKASEFSGSVSVAGSKIRANNFANYNRDTVQAYMDEYNSLLDNTMGEALGKAQTEYKSIATLIAGLQESTTNNTLEGQELEDAKRQLEIALGDYKKKFGIEYNPKIIPDLTKYAQTLFDKWTNAGSSLYEQDILGALSRAMEMNPDDSNWRITAMNSAADANVKDTDKWVKSYIESQKTFLRNAIAEESGMSIESVEKFLENSGINPLEFFDKKYVQEYQNKIMSWLSEQNVSEERKKSILAAIGLDLDDMEKYIKKVKEDAANAKAESVKKAQADIKEMVKDGIYTPYEQNQLAEMYGTEIAQEVEALIDAKKYMKPFDKTETPVGTLNRNMQAAESSVLPDWATSGDAMEYVQTGILPEMPVTPVIDEEDVVPNLSGQLKNALPDGGLPLEVNPYISTTWDGFTFDDSTLEGIYKHLNWQLADAGFEGGNRTGYQKIIDSLKSAENIDTMNMLSDLIEEKGVVEAFKKLKELNLNPDGTFGNVANPARMRASNGTAVGIGAGGTGSTTEPQPVEIDFTGMTASVQKGSHEANRDVVDGLAAVVLGLQRLLGKEWNINITPSTALGRTVGRSNQDLESVTGYYNG